MYSLFGGGFTVEFAVFPIAQKRVLSVGFSSYTQLPLLSRLCLGTQMPGGSREMGLEREDGPRLQQGPA